MPDATPDGLLIRAVRHDDCEALTALVNLPGFRAGTLRLPYQSIEQTRKRLEREKGDFLDLVAVLDGQTVGSAGFDRYTGRRSHAAGLGMGVHDDHHGKGIGTALMREIVDAAETGSQSGALSVSGVSARTFLFGRTAASVTVL